MRTAGVQPVPRQVHRNGQATGGYDVGDDFAPAPGAVPKTVNEYQRGGGGHEYSLLPDQASSGSQVAQTQMAASTAAGDGVGVAVLAGVPSLPVPAWR